MFHHIWNPKGRTVFSPSLGSVPSRMNLIHSIIPYVRSTLILLLYLNLVLPICLFPSGSPIENIVCTYTSVYATFPAHILLDILVDEE